MIEGFHGVPYASPLGRTREIVHMVRRGMRREKLTNDGLFKLPLSKEDGAVAGHRRGRGGVESIGNADGVARGHAGEFGIPASALSPSTRLLRQRS